MKIAEEYEDEIEDYSDETTTERRLKSLERRVVAAEKKYRKLAERISRSEALIELLDPEQSSGCLDDLQEAVKDMRMKIRAETLKNMVMSEVSRRYPGILQGLLVALDNLDDWWIAREGWSLGMWKEELLKLGGRKE